MSLINLILILAVIGVILWLVNSVIPMAGWLKTVINAVAVICVIVFLLQAFGLVGDISAVKVPRLGK